MSYTVKKLGFFAGAGSLHVSFIADPAARQPTLKPGSKAEVRVAPGLAPTSRANPRVAANWDTALAGVKLGGKPLVTASPPVLSTSPAAAQSVPPPPPPPATASVSEAARPPVPLGPPAPIASYPAATSTLQAPVVNSASSSRASSASPNPLGKRPPPPPPKKKKLPTYRAIYAYQAQEADELTFEEGDLLYLIKEGEDGWLVGTKAGAAKEGLFPSNYVEKVE